MNRPRNDQNFKASPVSQRRSVRRSHSSYNSRFSNKSRWTPRDMHPINYGYFPNNQFNYYNVNGKDSKYRCNWNSESATTTQNPPANEVVNEESSNSAIPENAISIQNSTTIVTESVATTTEESKKATNIKMELEDSSDDSGSDSNIIELKYHDNDQNNVIVKEVNNLKNNNLIKIKTELSSRDTEETNINHEEISNISEHNNINYKENINVVDHCNFINVKSVDSINGESNKIGNTKFTQRKKKVHKVLDDVYINDHDDIRNGICVYNIPLTLQDLHLVTFFERYGKIKKFRFFNCKTFTKSKYCYITFGNSKSAAGALEANGLVISKHVFQVYLRLGEKLTSHIIRARRCPTDSTIEDVYNTFEPYGPIEFVTLYNFNHNGVTANVKFEMQESFKLVSQLVNSSKTFTIKKQRLKVKKGKLSRKNLNKYREAMK